MEKNNLLFTYRKFEYTPPKSCDYRFEISKDYQCGFTFKLYDELDNEVNDQTGVVSLTPEEISVVNEMCSFLRLQPEPEEKYFGYGDHFSVILHVEPDKKFVDELAIKEKADHLLDFIRSHHIEELGVDLTDNLLNNMIVSLIDVQRNGIKLRKERKK